MQPPGDWDDRSFQSHSLSPACPEGKWIALWGASVRAAAESAKRAGFSVLGIDQFGDTDTLAACNRHIRITAETELEQLAGIRGGLPLLRVGGLSRLGWIVPRVAGERTDAASLIAATVAKQIGEPEYLRALAAAAGIEFPMTLGGEEFGTSARHGRWLRKNRHSCGGLAVRWLDPAAAHKINSSECLQRWINGTPYGATLITNGDGVSLLGVCRMLFTRQSDRPFVYAGSLGPLSVPRMIAARLLRLGRELVAQSKFRGLFNVDFVVDRRGKPWLLEINPRWSSSSELIERGLIDRGRIRDAHHAGDSLVRRWIDALEGGEIRSLDDGLAEKPQSRSPCPVYLKRIIYARRTTRFDHTTATQLLWGNESLHDIPADGHLVLAGQPICTLITKIDENENDPMRRHRVVVRSLSSPGSYSSPRSSAYE